MSVVYIEHWIY